MTVVKTVIPIQKSIFQRAEEIAGDLKISLDRFFMLAIEDYIRRYENGLLLEQINRAYADDPDPEEQETLRRMGRKSIKSLESIE